MTFIAISIEITLKRVNGKLTSYSHLTIAIKRSTFQDNNMANGNPEARGKVVTLGSQPRELGPVGQPSTDMWPVPPSSISSYEWPLEHSPRMQPVGDYSIFSGGLLELLLSGEPSRTPAEQVANGRADVLEGLLKSRLGEGKVSAHAFLPQEGRSYMTRVIDEYPKTFGEQTKGVVSPNTLHSLSIIPVVDSTLSQGNNLDTLRDWVEKQLPAGSSVKPDFTQLGQAHEEKGKRNHMIVVETPVDVEAGGKGKGKSVDMIVILPSATPEASSELVEKFLAEDGEKAQERSTQARLNSYIADRHRAIEEGKRREAEANAQVQELRLPRLKWVHGKHMPKLALLNGTKVTVHYPDQTVQHTDFSGNFTETKTRPAKRRVFGWRPTRLDPDQQAAFGDAVKRYQDAEMIKHPMKHVPLETVTLPGVYEENGRRRWRGYRSADGSVTSYRNNKDETYTTKTRSKDGRETEETHQGYVSAETRRWHGIPLKTRDLSVTRPISNPLPAIPQEK